MSTAEEIKRSRPKIGRSHHQASSGAIPIEKWGRDHWTTLLYIEHCCVDSGGEPNFDKLRCDTDRHPFYAGRYARHVGTAGLKKYPTRLKGGEEREDHDDWDCIEDMVHAGVVLWVGTGAFPVFELTEYGRQLGAALRQHYSHDRNPNTFEPPPPPDITPEPDPTLDAFPHIKDLVED